jgi:hypothetical protein
MSFRESRRDELNVIFSMFSESSEKKQLPKLAKMKWFFAIFCKKKPIFCKIRVGTSFSESERVRQKLEKLVSTQIFGKTRFPKLAKTKISAKAVFRRALFHFHSFVSGCGQMNSAFAFSRSLNCNQKCSVVFYRLTEAELNALNTNLHQIFLLFLKKITTGREHRRENKYKCIFYLSIWSILGLISPTFYGQLLKS